MALYLNKDTVYRAAKATDKDYKISDGGGLSMLVKTNGVKRWVFVYRFEGKQNMLGFGVYPDVSLETPRRKADEARARIADGINPAGIRQKERDDRQAAKISEDRQKQGLPIINSFSDITYRTTHSSAT